MKWLFKWAFRLIFLFVALVVVLALSLDSILQAMLERRIRARTGMDVQIGKFSVGFLSPVVNIRDLKIYNTAEFGGTPFLDIRELHLEYNRTVLVGRKLHIALMRLNLTELTVVKNDAGKTNVVVSSSPAPPGRTNAVAEAEFGSIDLLNLSVGKVRFVNLKEPARSREYRPDMQNQIFKNVRMPEDLPGILSWIWFRSGAGFRVDRSEEDRRGSLSIREKICLACAGQNSTFAAEGHLWN